MPTVGEQERHERTIAADCLEKVSEGNRNLQAELAR
jgi:hypothetical protein